MNKLRHFLPLAGLFCALLSLSQSARAQTAFTYQGQLSSGGQPVTGLYDLEFSLFATVTNGAAVAGPVVQSNVGVTNGLFTTTVDFGAIFNGNNYWLEIATRTNGASNFVTLSPRQAVTPTPQALYAPSAGTAQTAVTIATNGSIPLSALPPGVTTNGGTFTGDGSGLTNLLSGMLTEQYLTQQKIVLSNSGVSTITVPANAARMIAKLWGAGGSSRAMPGGAGGFAMVTLPVTPGQTFTAVVGVSGVGTSGVSSGGSSIDPLNSGGQATSLFLRSGSVYITKAIAGAGGAGGSSTRGGAGGGTTGQSTGAIHGGFNGAGGLGDVPADNGDDYSTTALTTGITNLALADGDGGAASSPFGGSGGGGYGGGGGGGVNNGGAGGASYGDTTENGFTTAPGNASDPDYLLPNAQPGSDGLMVIAFQRLAPYSAAPFQAVSFIGDGSSLTDLQTSNLVGTINTSSLVGTINASNLTGTLPATSFQATMVTNFPDAVGPLAPATFTFTSNGGTLEITTAGSGSANSAPSSIGMTVALDGTNLGGNHVWANNSAVHMAFVPKTFVLKNISAGSHVLKLTAIAGTITDLNDTFTVTVAELPY